MPKWTVTNGLVSMRLCDVCGQPYREGHIDCSCPENHPEPCDRPTYSQLTRQRDALLEAAKAAHNGIDILFSMLIERDSEFYPSKSGPPWEAILLLNAAIAAAEQEQA